MKIKSIRFATYVILQWAFYVLVALYDEPFMNLDEKLEMIFTITLLLPIMVAIQRGSYLLMRYIYHEEVIDNSKAN